MSGLGAQGDPNKWNMPGWRVEASYKPLTLMGNWYEERRNFNRTNIDHNSTHRTDFTPYPGHRPDVIQRRRGQITQEGLPERLFTRHHEDRWDNMCITMYDQNYNKRERTGRNKLPPLRSYNTTHKGWKPEQSDHPVEGRPTNFGLYKQKLKEWDEEKNIWKKHIQQGRYKDVYTTPPADSFPSRYGIAPKFLSSKLQPITRTNKNMSFRGEAPHNIAPERPPAIPKPSENYPIIAPMPCRT